MESSRVTPLINVIRHHLLWRVSALLLLRCLVKLILSSHNNNISEAMQMLNTAMFYAAMIKSKSLDNEKTKSERTRERRAMIRRECPAVSLLIGGEEMKKINIKLKCEQWKISFIRREQMLRYFFFSIIHGKEEKKKKNSRENTYIRLRLNN